MTPACTEEDFKKNTAEHLMEIVRDDGLYRHLKFRKPGTSVYWYDLHTWPGALCIDGDCGTFVFRRLEDMFEFFRTDRVHNPGQELFINPHYWAEKCVSAGGRRGVQAWSKDKFHEAVKYRFLSYFEDLPDDVRSRAWDEIASDVLTYDENPHEAYMAVDEFSFEMPSGRTFRFTDFWESNCEDYTFDFLWCCYAIAQGVKRYDAAKAVEPGVAV